VRVLVKLENHNPTGSHKVSVALQLVESAEGSALINPGMILAAIPTEGHLTEAIEVS